jgi:hypothetical protein
MLAGLLDAVVGTLERLAARGGRAGTTVRSLERRVAEMEPAVRAALAEASAEARASRAAVGKWLRDTPHTVLPSGGVVEHVIDDVSKCTPLLLAYAGPVRADPAVGAFCDEELTYIVPPRLHASTYETMRVACGHTTVELHYRLVPSIAYVSVDGNADSGWVIGLHGSRLYAANTALHVTVGGSDPVVLETPLDDTTDGTRLRFHLASHGEVREFTCQLVNMADSRLSSGHTSVQIQVPLNPES